MALLPDNCQRPPHADWFPTTHWSVVRLAGGQNSNEGDAALAKLCQTYWYPLYGYVRRLGHGPEDAQDLTQEFFARLLEKRYLASVAQEKGKFRSFLLIVLQRFLANDYKRTSRQKRGGGQKLISIDEEDSEGRFLAEPATDSTPEKEFARSWAMVVLGEVLDKLEAELVSTGRGKIFEELKVFLTGEGSSLGYRELATKLEMSEGTLKATVHRLRHRYREMLRFEIAHTVSQPDEIDDEIRHLFRAVWE